MEVVGWSNVFREAMHAIITMPHFQLMLLIFGLSVSGLLSLLALLYWVRRGIKDNEYI